jgi:hypothetical protein
MATTATIKMRKMAIPARSESRKILNATIPRQGPRSMAIMEQQTDFF